MQPVQFRRLVRLVAERGGDATADGRPGRQWALDLPDRVLLVAAYCRVDQIAVVDGILIPTRDHRLAAQSKNYRYSANLQVAIDAARVVPVRAGGLVVAVRGALHRRGGSMDQDAREQGLLTFARLVQNLVEDSLHRRAEHDAAWT